MTLLLLADGPRGEAWSEVFGAAGRALVIGEANVRDPAAITHLACWTPPADLARYPNLRVVLSLGAGIDQMPLLPAHIALVRSLAPGITKMVRDWVVMATLMLHRDMTLYLAQAARGEWRAHRTHPAQARRVGILGFGRIGRAVAESLSALGFDVAAVSRSATGSPHAMLYRPEEEAAFLARSDILICVLPLTPETAGKLDATLLARLPRGARLVQAGRGLHLDLNALRVALDTGQIACAALDVTDPEPLPRDHWAWADPRVIVTPHVGSVTDDREGAGHALRLLDAEAAGRPLPGLVERSRGY